MTEAPEHRQPEMPHRAGIFLKWPLIMNGPSNIRSEQSLLSFRSDYFAYPVASITWTKNMPGAPLEATGNMVPIVVTVPLTCAL